MKKLYISLAVLVSILLALLLPAQPGGGPIFVPPVPTPGVFFNTNPNILLSNTTPSIRIYETDAGSNAKWSDLTQTAGTMEWSLISDDGGSTTVFWRLTRSGATPTLYEVQPPFQANSSVSIAGGDETFLMTNQMGGNPVLFKIGSATALSISGDGNATVTIPNNGVVTKTLTAAQVNIGSYSYTISTNAQTADATITTIASFPVPTDTAITISAIVTAKQASSANGASYHVEAGGSNNGGSTAIIATQTIVHEKESITATAGITIDFDNTTDTGRVRVTGVAGTTIRWGADITVIVTPSP